MMVNKPSSSSFPAFIVSLLLLLLLFPVVVVLGDEQDAQTCVERLQQEVQLYQNVSYFSVALVFINLMIALAMQSRFVAHPKCAYQYYFSMAAVKILLAILLSTILWPYCPSGCGTCTVPSHYYIYPVIVLMVGVSWTCRGMKFYRAYKQQLAREAAANLEAVAATDGDGFTDGDGDDGDEAEVAVAMTSTSKDTKTSKASDDSDGII